MTCCRKTYARKAAWLAFGLVALAAITSTAQAAAVENSLGDVPNVSSLSLSEFLDVSMNIVFYPTDRNSRSGDHSGSSGHNNNLCGGNGKHNTSGTQRCVLL